LSGTIRRDQGESEDSRRAQNHPRLSWADCNFRPRDLCRPGAGLTVCGRQSPLEAERCAFGRELADRPTRANADCAQQPGGGEIREVPAAAHPVAVPSHRHHCRSSRGGHSIHQDEPTGGHRRNAGGDFARAILVGVAGAARRLPELKRSQLQRKRGFERAGGLPGALVLLRPYFEG